MYERFRKASEEGVEEGKIRESASRSEKGENWEGKIQEKGGKRTKEEGLEEMREKMREKVKEKRENHENRQINDQKMHTEEIVKCEKLEEDFLRLEKLCSTQKQLLFGLHTTF